MVRRPYANGDRLDRSWNSRRFSSTLSLPQPIAIYAKHVTHAYDDHAANIPNAIAVSNAITVSAAKPRG